MGRPRKPPVPAPPELARARTAKAVLQWASETGAQGMPIPLELERVGWHRLAEHPLYRGTWLMEADTPTAAPRESSHLKLTPKHGTG